MPAESDGPRIPWWVTRLLLPALPVAGILLYGVLRQLYAQFYGSLGASPEDVGLGYAEILSLSALGLAWLGLVFLGLALAWLLVYCVAARTPLTTPTRARPLAVVGVVTTALALLLGALSLISTHPDLAAHLVVVAVVVPATFWGIVRIDRRPLRAAAAVSVVAVIFMGGTILVGRTSDLAAHAYEGNSVRSLNLLGFQVLGLRAEPATFTWVDTPPAKDELASKCLLYLGSANGTATFYDPDRNHRRTVRIQASRIAISVLRTVNTYAGEKEPVCNDGQVTGG